MTETQRNKEAFRVCLDAPIGDADAIERYFDPQIRLPADVKGGLDGLRELYATYGRQFDQRARVMDLVAEGDRVFARVVTSGTHIGHVEEMLLARFRDGRMVGVRRVADRLSLYQQLGGTIQSLCGMEDAP